MIIQPWEDSKSKFHGHFVITSEINHLGLLTTSCMVQSTGSDRSSLSQHRVNHFLGITDASTEFLASRSATLRMWSAGSDHLLF